MRSFTIILETCLSGLKTLDRWQLERTFDSSNVADTPWLTYLIQLRWGWLSML